MDMVCLIVIGKLLATSFQTVNLLGKREQATVTGWTTQDNMNIIIKRSRKLIK